jgi:hypothetical protein
MDESPKFFGTQREPAADQASASAPGPVFDRKSILRSRWFKRLVSVAVLLLVLAVCVVGYSRVNNYGTRVVRAHPVDARIEIINPPAWLDRRIVASLLDEAYQFAQKDEATYSRSRDTLDAGILRDFAALYTGPGNAGVSSVTGPASTAPAPLSPQATGYNAWIKRVTEVRRDVARDKSIQTIQISAEWRQPVAWVRVKDMLYLIDADGTRLPGDYHLEDRPHSRLMVIAGVDLPSVGGTPAVPQPGEKWAAKDGGFGADMLAGMSLVNELKRQPFAAQIDAVNMANYAGRQDPLLPWIDLETIWRTADGSPRVVHWGRPVGEERIWEVQATAKLKTLNELFERFGRIDADRDYVDIRTEVVRLPKLAMAG